ncbi:peptidoglycan D,D-transpeptidase FtsI family protein [Dethiosulfatarculus sandiegensis]|uniref:Penicillin-binding protein transpeptidase domain-containing protein n=1 Tax=Dethiosulfatarculus sandiegensis TaxID=1429043 RepID=A0A0D2J669_9BACT|nr:penicillin-binding transpeptidase domain-containing protein [Dethiosulfatarculus sandiegensis]KIX11206.1 hypothetical protein X474_25415 [Dethiosulfatarculus sandiegensis]
MKKFPEHRTYFTALILLAALVSIGARLYWLQVENRGKILKSSYVDQDTLRLLNRLKEKGVLKPSRDGKVRIDQNALNTLVENNIKRQRIKRIAARARLYPGQKEFDYRLVRVLAPGKRNTSQKLLKGRILDRKGLTLAETKITGRTGSRTRHYPMGAVSEQVLGFSHPVYGSHGLEAALSPILNSPDPSKPPMHLVKGQKPLPRGVDAYLTLDADLQQKAAEIFGSNKGAAVILNTRTGAVLAAVGAPAFDSNSKDHDAWFEARTKDRGAKLRSRAWEKLYPPGSTFKLVTAAAWLEEHKQEKKQYPRIYCTGFDKKLNISDISAHGRTDMKRAIVKSCNIYFARLGFELGPKVREMAERFGFNRQLDLIPQLGTISLPAQPGLAYAQYEYVTQNQESKKQRIKRLKLFNTFERDPKIAAQCAIGQNLVSATPLQMAMVAGTIANDGLLMPPHLVMGIGNPQNPDEFEALNAGVGKRVISPRSARQLRQMMTEVMISGTGRTAPHIQKNLTEIKVAGKTGTAETGRDNEKPHAWFIGFAPADNPRVAVALVNENGGLGSKFAAPLAVRMLAAALEAEIKEDKER